MKRLVGHLAFSVVAVMLSAAAKGVASPSALRYLHCVPSVGNIFNEMDLSLGVFIEDEWVTR